MCSGIDESSLNRIVKLIESPNSTIIDFLKEEKIIEALNRGISRVQDFFLKHIDDFLKVISDEVPVENSSIKITALSILTKYNIPYFSEKIFKSESFLKWLSEFPSSPKVNSQNIVIYTKIVLYLRKSYYYCLNSIPDKCSFFPNLIKQLKYSSIYYLLSIITEDLRTPVIRFLKEVNATQQFLDHISDDSEFNLLILHLIRSIVESCDIGNPLLDTFMEEKTFNLLYKLIFNSGDCSIAQECIRILYLVLILVVSKTQEEREENEIYHTLYRMVKNNINDFVDLILNSKTIGIDVVNSINLISLMIRLGLDINDKIVDMTVFLFNQMLERPYYSIFHLAFLDLFIKLSYDQQTFLKIVSECQLIQKIPEIFDDSEGKLCTHLGILFKMTGIIIKKIPKINDSEWDDYISTRYDLMKSLTTIRINPIQKRRLQKLSDDDSLTKEEIFDMISEGSFLSDEDDEDDEDDEGGNYDEDGNDYESEEEEEEEYSYSDDI